MVTKLTNDRVIALAKTVVDKNYPENAIRSIAGIDPYTLTRWAEGVSNPRRISLKGLCKIISITEETLRQYLDREIELDTLWARSGESAAITPAVELSYDKILFLVKNLKPPKKMALVQEILSEYNGTLITNIVLSDKEKERLKTLALESLRYYQADWGLFKDKGIDSSLIDDMQGSFTGDYSKDIFDSLAKVLFKAKQWITDSLVVIDYPKVYSNWDELRESLE